MLVGMAGKDSKQNNPFVFDLHHFGHGRISVLVAYDHVSARFDDRSSDQALCVRPMG